MTTITMDLPDELIEQAKQQGVFNEQDLTNLTKAFLASQLRETQTLLQEKNWQDYFPENDFVDSAKDGMLNRQFGSDKNGNKKSIQQLKGFIKSDIQLTTEQMNAVIEQAGCQGE